MKVHLCFGADGFMLPAFSSEVATGSREENAFIER
jgi:hypothetical protein